MTARQMPTDELHWRLSDALRRRRLDGWPRQFAVSFVGACKRGRAPSAKMEHIARQIVADLRAPVPMRPGEPLIEEAHDEA